MLKKKRGLLSLLAILAAAALIGAGCGSDDDAGETETATTTEATEAEAPSTDTGAAELRANLTALLDEHVQLAGIAFVKGVGAGLESAEFAAAAESLDGNSQDLAGAIGSVYGEDAGEQFLALWRSHIDMFVDYTAGKATGDEQAMREAARELGQYGQDFGAFLESANPNLSQEAIVEALGPHVDSVFRTIDAVVDGEGDPFALLQEAVGHMPVIANVLAGAIAEQNPELFDGEAESPAAELRADLTHLLHQHVYAAAIAIDTGLGAGLDSPEFELAADAVDQNSRELAAAIGSVYGEEAGEQFLALWRTHIDMFVDYAAAQATGDEQTAREARRGLDEYREDFGAFLEAANPNLTREAVAEALAPHTRSVFVVIDNAVEGNPQVFDDMRAAAGHMPGIANVLAGAIVAQFPEQFGG